MQYSLEELSAVTALGLFASAIDGDIDEKELQLIFSHLGTFTDDIYLRRQLLKDAGNIPFIEAAAVINCMDYDQKRHFAAFIGSIILADGKLTDEELEYWKNLSAATNLPVMTIQEAAEIFLSNMLVNL